MCQFTNELKNKAISLGFPYIQLKAIIEYNTENSELAKAWNKNTIETHLLTNIVERGVLIGGGNRGHLVLVEWKYVKNII